DCGSGSAHRRRRRDHEGQCRPSRGAEAGPDRYRQRGLRRHVAARQRPLHARAGAGGGRDSEMSLAESPSESRRGAYASQIGRARRELTTPALILDLDVAKRNIESMAVAFRELPAQLRPHVKAHRSPQLARLQMEAGAVGVATATVWEAMVMA